MLIEVDDALIGMSDGVHHVTLRGFNLNKIDLGREPREGDYALPNSMVWLALCGVHRDIKSRSGEKLSRARRL